MNSMQWEDLKDGDILEYNPEFLQRFEEVKGRRLGEQYSVIENHVDKFHVVDHISNYTDTQINISFKDVGTGVPPTIPIDKNTGAFFELLDGPPAFNILSIIEEIENVRKNHSDDE
jgi:hypothetical protein